MKVSELISALKGFEDFDIEFSFDIPSASFPNIRTVSDLKIQDIAYSDKKVVLGSDDPIHGLQSVVIPLPGGKQLVAEPGHDPHYPREIFVSQRNTDGTEQDIAYIGQKYTLGSDPVEYQDNAYEVLTVNQYGDFDRPQKNINLTKF